MQVGHDTAPQGVPVTTSAPPCSSFTRPVQTLLRPQLSAQGKFPEHPLCSPQVGGNASLFAPRNPMQVSDHFLTWDILNITPHHLLGATITLE